MILVKCNTVQRYRRDSPRCTVGPVIVVSKDDFTSKLVDVSKTSRKGFGMTGNDGTVGIGSEGVDARVYEL